MTEETPSGSTGVHAEDERIRDADSATVRDFLDEVGVDPTDLESIGFKPRREVSRTPTTRMPVIRTLHRSTWIVQPQS